MIDDTHSAVKDSIARLEKAADILERKGKLHTARLLRESAEKRCRLVDFEATYRSFIGPAAKEVLQEITGDEHLSQDQASRERDALPPIYASDTSDLPTSSPCGRVNCSAHACEYNPDCPNHPVNALEKDPSTAHPEFPEGCKDSNPKDRVGITKVPYSTIPTPVLAELGLAMLEGALKYGRHNYRFAGVRASVYYDACVARHLARWWEGEDIDPDTIVRDEKTGEVIFEGIHHVTKAIAGLAVIRDAMIHGKFIDDRPPHSPPEWQDKINVGVRAFNMKYPDPVAPFYDGFERGPGRII